MEALHLLREDKDAFYLFVCNTGYRPDKAKPRLVDRKMVRDRLAAFPDVRIRGFAGCEGTPLELDPATGDIHAADAARDGGAWEIRTSLTALGSRLFVLPKKTGGEVAAAERKPRIVRETPVAGARWDYSLSENNCLVLDRPRFRVAGVSG